MSSKKKGKNRHHKSNGGRQRYSAPKPKAVKEPAETPTVSEVPKEPTKKNKELQEQVEHLRVAGKADRALRAVLVVALVAAIIATADAWSKNIQLQKLVDKAEAQVMLDPNRTPSDFRVENVTFHSLPINPSSPTYNSGQAEYIIDDFTRYSGEVSSYYKGFDCYTEPDAFVVATSEYTQLLKDTIENSEDFEIAEIVEEDDNYRVVTGRSENKPYQYSLYYDIDGVQEASIFFNTSGVGADTVAWEEVTRLLQKYLGLDVNLDDLREGHNLTYALAQKNGGRQVVVIATGEGVQMASIVYEVTDYGEETEQFFFTARSLVQDSQCEVTDEHVDEHIEE